MWAPKNGGFSDVDSQKWGSFSVQKMQFQGKICKFSVKSATKIAKFLKMRAKRAKSFAIFM